MKNIQRLTSFFWCILLFQMTAMGEKRFENPQTSNMNKILRDCILVREYLMELNQPLSGESEEQHKPVKKPWVCGIAVTSNYFQIRK